MYKIEINLFILFNKDLKMMCIMNVISYPNMKIGMNKQKVKNKANDIQISKTYVINEKIKMIRKAIKLANSIDDNQPLYVKKAAWKTVYDLSSEIRIDFDILINSDINKKSAEIIDM
jgi:Tfp pilus assembly protein FimT